MQPDPGVDILLLQEARPREAGSARAESYIAMVEATAAAGAEKPIAFVTPVSHGQTDYSRALRARAPHVSFLQEANKALRAIAAVARARECERLAGSAQASNEPRTPERAQTIERLVARASGTSTALDEAESKALLRLYGIAAPAEALVTSPRMRSAPPIASAIRSCSRRSRPRSRTNPMPARSPSTSEARRAGGRIRGHVRAPQAARAHRHAGLPQIRGGVELVLGLHATPRWAWW